MNALVIGISLSTIGDMYSRTGSEVSDIMISISTDGYISHFPMLEAAAIPMWLVVVVKWLSSIKIFASRTL
jgi:hypothetical protein